MDIGSEQVSEKLAYYKDRPSDRNYHLLFVALCWLGVLAGFAPAVSDRMHGLAAYPAPLILQVHVFSFVGWLVLLSLQVALVRKARRTMHRRLGLSAFALVPVMVLSGFLAEVYAQRFRLDHMLEGLAFFIIPIWNVTAFGVLASAALWLRSNSPAHKRLIVMATTVISGVGFDRWWGETVLEWFGEGQLGLFVATYAGANALLLLALTHDLRTRGNIHPVNLWGAVFIFAGEVMTTIVFHTPGWLPVARWIIGR